MSRKLPVISGEQMVAVLELNEKLELFLEQCCFSCRKDDGDDFKLFTSQTFTSLPN